MFIKFNEEVQRILKKSKIEMKKLKHPFIGSEHLILSILSYKNNVSDKLIEYGINYDAFRSNLIKTMGYGKKVNNYFIYTPLLKRVLENAIIEAKENNYNEITLEGLTLSLLDEGEGVGNRILVGMGVNVDELYSVFSSKENNNSKNKKKLSVYEFGIDLNKKASDKKIDPVIGRDKEVNKLIEVLSRRTKNNPLLIGEAGVGKTAIVEELARRITNNSVPDSLIGMKVISIQMSSLVAGTKYRGEFEDRINKVLKEVENNSNIIIFIDEVHLMVGAGGAEGAIDASNILKPALSRGKIRLIGATTINEYRESIAEDKALNRRFQVIKVEESTIEETKSILREIKALYEEYHRVKISDALIDKLVELSSKYIYDRKNPDKSIDILDEVCAKVSLAKNKRIIKLDSLKNNLKEIKLHKKELIINHLYIEAEELKKEEMALESKINTTTLELQKDNSIKEITLNDIGLALKEKSGIPIYEISKIDFNELNNLDKNLKNRVIGQDKVIDELVQLTKKIKLGYKSNNLPVSLLFIGSTGVGKTMLVKEYSKLMNVNLIRLDMSEYREGHSVSKIIGSPPGYVGYNDYKNVLEKVRNNPYSIILLDEIEKASKEVINLFLQVLDEGVINDSRGNEVNFNNTIIIMTSNIGGNSELIGFNSIDSNIDTKLKEVLSVEFINRISGILQFNKINEESIYRIVNKKISEIKNRFSNNNIKLKINRSVIEDIIKEADYLVYGARKLNNIIENKIDNIVIDSLLKGQNSIVIKNI